MSSVSIRRPRRALSSIVLEIGLILVSLVIIVPLLIMVLGSFKTAGEAMSFNIDLPKNWRFDNYLYVIQKANVPQAFGNSLLITSLAVAVCISFSALCAYVIARRDTRTSRGAYAVCLLGMVAPLQMVTTFALLKGLGLIGSYPGVILILVAAQLPWSIFIFSGFIKTVPLELDEAAIIDGASPLRLFAAIILPLLQPVVVTNIVIITMSVWNDFMIPLYFLNSPDKWTMPLTVYGFFGQYMSDWNYVFADLVLTALPVVILYLFAQRYIVAGMTAGSVKG